MLGEQIPHMWRGMKGEGDSRDRSKPPSFPFYLRRFSSAQRNAGLVGVRFIFEFSQSSKPESSNNEQYNIKINQNLRKSSLQWPPQVY